LTASPKSGGEVGDSPEGKLDVPVERPRSAKEIHIPTATWVLAILVGAVLGLVWWEDRGSLERGNRLFRAGRAEAAAEVYGSWVDTTAVGLLASYNMGTALLGIGSEEAERHLLRATEGRELEAVRRAHYNLGYRLMEGLDADSDPFSAVPLLVSAMEHSRAALRIDPFDEDAQWNLALAGRIYGALALVFEEGPVEGTRDDAEGPIQRSEETAETSRSGGAGVGAEDSPPLDRTQEGTGPQEGAPETLARGDPGPLPEDAVMSLLQGRIDDTALLVRGILWSQRPVGGSSGGEPFLGGVR
jgi:hypothetical protein